ncbi:MAG: AAA family ATPase, partial [Methylococcales bacterium]|nr:AAA family ATPase [Methylococcales bacterium]
MEPLKRNLIKKINNLLEFFPVVALLGGRQCGKTTLAKMCRPDWAYFDLERDDVFDRVNGDSLLFLAEHHSNIIIDEAQKSPILFNH